MLVKFRQKRSYPNHHLQSNLVELSQFSSQFDPPNFVQAFRLTESILIHLLSKNKFVTKISYSVLKYNQSQIFGEFREFSFCALTHQMCEKHC